MKVNLTTKTSRFAKRTLVDFSKQMSILLEKCL